MKTRCFMCDSRVNNLSVNDLCPEHYKEYHKKDEAIYDLMETSLDIISGGDYDDDE